MVGDLKWISVWSRRLSVDFGHLIFPDDLGLSKSEPEPRGGGAVLSCPTLYCTVLYCTVLYSMVTLLLTSLLL